MAIHWCRASWAAGRSTSTGDHSQNPCRTVSLTLPPDHRGSGIGARGRNGQPPRLTRHFKVGHELTTLVELIALNRDGHACVLLVEDVDGGSAANPGCGTAGDHSNGRVPPLRAGLRPQASGVKLDQFARLDRHADGVRSRRPRQQTRTGWGLKKEISAERTGLDTANPYREGPEPRDAYQQIGVTKRIRRCRSFALLMSALATESIDYCVQLGEGK